MLLCVAVVRTKVSEGPSSSIITVTRIGDLYYTLIEKHFLDVTSLVLNGAATTEARSANGPHNQVDSWMPTWAASGAQGCAWAYGDECLPLILPSITVMSHLGGAVPVSAQQITAFTTLHALHPRQEHMCLCGDFPPTAWCCSRYATTWLFNNCKEE
jgi:hypothetical protein